MEAVRQLTWPRWRCTFRYRQVVAQDVLDELFTAKLARSGSRARVVHMFPDLDYPRAAARVRNLFTVKPAHSGSLQDLVLAAADSRHAAASERSLLAEPQPEVAASVPELSSVASGTQLIAPW